MPWAHLLKVDLHNHSPRSVAVISSDLVHIEWGTGAYGEDRTTTQRCIPVGRKVIGPGTTVTSWLPVAHSMREWSALHDDQDWQPVATITVDDGQDHGVTERREIHARLRPIEQVDADTDPHGPQRCSGCGDRLWRVKPEISAEVIVSPATRRYFYSKTEGHEVPKDGPSWLAHTMSWVKRWRRRRPTP